MQLFALPVVLSILAYTAAVAPTPVVSSKPLPVLLWHGLGDRHDNEGLHGVGDLINEINPDTYIHYIRLNDNGDEDRKATFFGNVSDQIAQVCHDLQQDKELIGDDGLVRADALGFSQGGQFLRGLVERCENVTVRTLVTFGSQHNGIADVQACGQWDFLCKGALALMRGNVWTPWVQSNIVPAQYYRTTDAETGKPTEEYLDTSGFLADVNNERDEKNVMYKERVEGLEMFVMVMFENDTTVIPKESAWFAEVDMTNRSVLPLRERDLYWQDWLGLRALDEKNGLVCISNPGDHMQLDDGIMRELFGLYFGPEVRKKKSVPVKWEGRKDGCGIVKAQRVEEPADLKMWVPSVNEGLQKVVKEDV